MKSNIAKSSKCSICQERPRLGTLSRCASCLQADANTDRQSRVNAELRVSGRQQRLAALEKLGELYLEFAGSAEGHAFLEAQQAALIAPRNDPEYLNAVLANEKDRQSVANEVSTVHHLVEWGRNTISLALRDDRNHAKAREVSALLQRLFEAGHRYHEDPHDPGKLADRSQKQTPRHEFGREKRSLLSRKTKRK